MRGWEIILVPVIALVVAVLASIFRGAEEMKRRQNQRTRAEPRRDRPRSEGSGIDQFLEEIRRRQAARQNRRERSSLGAEPSSELVAEERAAPVDPPRRSREPTREPPGIPVAVVLPSTPVVAPAGLSPTQAVPVVAPGLNEGPPGSAGASATRDTLGEMLRTKAGLRAAFVLGEIFSAPRCRQRR